MSERTGKQILKELSSVASRLAKREGEARVLREQRNKLVMEGRTGASDGPVKLKDLAAASNLGTTFIGRIEHGDGKPESRADKEARRNPTRGKGSRRAAAKR